MEGPRLRHGTENECGGGGKKEGGKRESTLKLLHFRQKDSSLLYFRLSNTLRNIMTAAAAGRNGQKQRLGKGTRLGMEDGRRQMRK